MNFENGLDMEDESTKDTCILALFVFSAKNTHNRVPKLTDTCILLIKIPTFLL